MRKNMRVYLEDIMESTKLIEEYTKGMEEADFFDNTAIQDAVMRRFEIIGEAAKNISNEVKEKHPSLPWREMAGMRDVLIHEYSGVNLGRVWRTIEKDLTGLKRKLKKLLEEFD